MPPLERETEITGPMMARLYVSSSTADTDLFLIVRVFEPAGKELTFMGSTDPNTPIANGWLRASHRRLDPAESRPWRPFRAGSTQSNRSTPWAIACSMSGIVPTPMR